MIILKINNIEKKKFLILILAQVSTSSFGKFDKKAHKDEPIQRVPRRKKVPDFKNRDEENSRNKGYLFFFF